MIRALFLLPIFLLAPLNSQDPAWQLEVVRQGEAITEVIWKSGDRKVQALTPDLFELAQSEPHRLKVTPGVPYALVTVPISKIGGLRGGVALLPPGQTASEEMIFNREPMKDPDVALNSDGFFLAFAEGDIVSVAFYNVQEMKLGILSDRMSLVRKRDGDTRITLTPAEAIIEDGGNVISFNQNGDQGQGEFIFTDLTEANKDIIVGQFNGKDLTRMALSGELECNGEETELVDRVIRNLLNRSKPNVILRGEAGVGMEAVVYALVKKIAEGRVPELQGWRVYQFRGSMFETEGLVGITDKKLNIFLNAVRQKKVILYLPQLEKYVGLGTARAGENDGSSTLVEDLAAGSIKVIGTTTNGQMGIGFVRSRERFHGTFEEYELKEPTGPKLFKIVKEAALLKQRQKNIRYSDIDEIVKKIIDLTTRYQPRLHQPEKSIKALNDLASKAPRSRDPKTQPLLIDDAMVVAWVSERTGIRSLTETISQNPTDGLRGFLKNYDREIGENWVGQEAAKKAIYQTLLSTLREGGAVKTQSLANDRGVRKLMFFGPSGVGKSYAPKELERLLLKYGVSWPYWAIEGSGLENESGVAVLFGAPRSYIGFVEGGGALFNFINDHPEAIIVFDEFDKVHQKVQNSLLPFWQFGRVQSHIDLTDVAYFKKGIVIMTSNFGMDLIDKFDRRRFFGVDDPELKGIRTVEDLTAAIKQSLIDSKIISPMIMGRIGNFVAFTHLSREEIARIVDLKLRELSEDYAYSDDAKLIFSNSFGGEVLGQLWNRSNGEPAFSEGARSVENFINNKITTAIENFKLDHGKNAKNHEWLLSFREGKIFTGLGKEVSR